MSAPPYARIHRFIAETKAGTKNWPIEPWTTPEAIVRDLINVFDPHDPDSAGSIFIECTERQMIARRLSMNNAVRRHWGLALRARATRLDPYAIGGPSRISPWEITIVVRETS